MISGDRLPTIEAARLRLRWLTAADVDSLFAIFAHPEVMRYWIRTAFSSRQEAVELLEEIHQCFADRSLFQWGLARRDDDRVIGTCTLSHLDAANRRAEVGFALGREYWGNGYVREALTVLFDFAFGTLNLHRIEADVDPRNAASIRTLERLGFQREGYLRERWHVGGEVQDAVFYGLLRRDFHGHAAAAMDTEVESAPRLPHHDHISLRHRRDPEQSAPEEITMPQLPPDAITGQLLAVLREAFEGPERWSYFTDHGPDAALFGTLVRLSAEQASRAHGGKSIAAHVHHVIFGLRASASWVRGERQQHNWPESWSVGAVDEPSWNEMQEQLRWAYEELRGAIQANATSSVEALGGAIGAVAHVAYHLGAIRQMATRVA